MDECSDDDDCAADEWCDRVLLVGFNQCVPKRTEGYACTRDEQCQSDCCKFYWIWWECRPADRCN